MTSTATAAPPALSAREQRGNIVRLTLAQALAGANSVVVYATAAIVGHPLSPDKALATLPVMLFVAGMAACIMPMGALARRHGRRTALAGIPCCGYRSRLSHWRRWHWLSWRCARPGPDSR